VKYLLDVNALLAWQHRRSPHHTAFHAWAAQTKLNSLRTCAHSELGFLRVSMQVFGYSLKEAQEALAAIKKQVGGFIADAPSPRLPGWATTAARTSDAYLTQLASQNHLTIATFDTGIPDAQIIRP
jgi:predicted nucleic acid-binding protein